MSSTSTGNPQTAPPFVVDGASVRLVVDTTVYRVSAIQKAGYRLARHFTLAMGVPEGNQLPVTLFLPSDQADKARETVEAFYRELCDQELRENIADQTKDIRALLLAHAFSRTDLVSRE